MLSYSGCRRAGGGEEARWGAGAVHILDAGASSVPAALGRRRRPKQAGAQAPTKATRPNSIPASPPLNRLCDCRDRQGQHHGRPAAQETAASAARSMTASPAINKPKPPTRLRLRRRCLSPTGSQCNLVSRLSREWRLHRCVRLLYLPQCFFPLCSAHISRSGPAMPALRLAFLRFQ